MIVEAIRALGHENGCNKTAISDYIKSSYGSNLPAQHNAVLTGHLARMKATGELAFLRNNYLLPNEDEASPLSTGGHKGPAAPEEESTGVLDVGDDVLLASPLVIDADAVDIDVPAPAPVVTTDVDDIDVLAPAPVVSADVNPVHTKRGRGRPPKPKDPVAEGYGGKPATAPVAAAAVPVKRGRGRPPKPKNPVAEDSAPTAASVVTTDGNAVPVKRGRGRPPKLKDPINVATDQATSGMLSPRGRGRPPKKAKVAVEDPRGEPAAARDVVADASAVHVKRGRGRPPR